MKHHFIKSHSLYDISPNTALKHGKLREGLSRTVDWVNFVRLVTPFVPVLSSIWKERNGVHLTHNSNSLCSFSGRDAQGDKLGRVRAWSISLTSQPGGDQHINSDRKSWLFVNKSTNAESHGRLSPNTARRCLLSFLQHSRCGGGAWAGEWQVTLQVTQSERGGASRTLKACRGASLSASCSHSI